MSHIMACIDGSKAAPAVCDYAAWAAGRTGAPLTLLHVLDKSKFPSENNFSGHIGLGGSQKLLEQMAELDQQRNRLALEQGRAMLEAAQQHLRDAGVAESDIRQRHGDLVDALSAMEEDIRILVMGRQGEDGDSVGAHVGNNVERVIRTLKKPILLTPATFMAPRNILLAYDGSPTTRKGLELIAASPLFNGITCHLVTVGDDNEKHRSALATARHMLEGVGLAVQSAILNGGVEAALRSYQRDNNIDMIVMGAFGHSALRQFFVGSTTLSMLQRAEVPLLVSR
ncbi:universal stress protein [Alcanivorax sp. JB21]|uniref:universal stress protein n=1 Tax=Alcanivorax limicola TaxID=2874102 RepID=UPI001CBB3629|nr:universal stress protein [Alcanivorax limicola]MBZ2190256.1 universal stress protein [Alcanivorax limicola]